MLVTVSRTADVILTAAVARTGIDRARTLRIATAIRRLDTADGPRAGGDVSFIAEAVDYESAGGLDAFADAEPRDAENAYRIARADAIRRTLAELDDGHGIDFRWNDDIREWVAICACGLRILAGINLQDVGRAASAHLAEIKKGAT